MNTPPAVFLIEVRGKIPASPAQGCDGNSWRSSAGWDRIQSVILEESQETLLVNAPEEGKASATWTVCALALCSARGSSVVS